VGVNLYRDRGAEVSDRLRVGAASRAALFGRSPPRLGGPTAAPARSLVGAASRAALFQQVRLGSADLPNRSEVSTDLDEDVEWRKNLRKTRKFPRRPRSLGEWARW